MERAHIFTDVEFSCITAGLELRSIERNKNNSAFGQHFNTHLYIFNFHIDKVHDTLKTNHVVILPQFCLNRVKSSPDFIFSNVIFCRLSNV